MELWQKIIEAYPAINATDDLEQLGIYLQDDSDNVGAFIAKWDYDEPIPKGLTLGKTSA
jgi:hypothetical protein